MSEKKIAGGTAQGTLPRSAKRSAWNRGEVVTAYLFLLPLLVGICYEILKWAGRSNSLLARAVSVPGLWLQHLTTFEPEDDMIEVAIAAATPVLPKKPEDGQW